MDLALLSNFQQTHKGIFVKGAAVRVHFCFNLDVTMLYTWASAAGGAMLPSDFHT